MHLSSTSKRARGIIARRIFSLGQSFSISGLPQLFGRSEPSTKFDLNFEEVSALFRVFRKAEAGDPSGKANVAKYTRDLLYQEHQKSHRWSWILQEHEKMFKSSQHAENEYLTWEDLCSKIEQCTTLCIGSLAEKVRLSQHVGGSGLGHLQAAGRVLTASQPLASVCLSLQEFKKLLRASGYPVSSQGPSSATTDLGQHKMEVEEKAMRLMQKSPRRESLPDVHARLEEMMVVDDERRGQEERDFDFDDDDEVAGGAQPGPADLMALKDEMVRSRIASLSPQLRAEALACLDLPATEDVLIEKFNIPITRRLMSALRPREWLNDEVCLPLTRVSLSHSA